jgi:hypothetical protein
VTRDEWRQVQPILTQALTLPEPDRNRLLETAALHDFLRRELMELLGSSAAAPTPYAVADAIGGSRASGEALAAVSSAVTLTSGDALADGRFVIVRQIGRGGMGAVYLAQDTTLGTLVALKVVPPDERLIQEAQRAAACSGHEHVATVHNVLRTAYKGQSIGVLVMDYVAGRPASRIVEDGPVDLERAVRWMRQAAAAVGHAHDCEVLHCDLKPANIMVTADDRVKVLDFGIARASFGGDVEPVHGTLPYMAPEQLRSGTFSRAGDVYSLGVTLFELLTGRLPFDGDPVMLRMEILAAPPPKLTELRPDAPPALDAIVQRALEKDPDKRFRSARAFARALEHLQVDQTGSLPLVVPATAASRSRGALIVPYLGGAIAVFATLTATLGFLACRSFEVVLRIEPEFAATLGDYFRIGREALLPFAVYWLVAAAALGVLLGAGVVIRWRATQKWRAWTDWWGRLDPNAVAVGTVTLGTVGWLTVTWRHSGIFTALLDLQQNPGAASVASISFASRPEHLAYATTSAYLSFILLVAGLRWLPRLCRRCPDPSTIRLMSWSALVVAFLVMVGPTLSRRFVFERFRVIEYQGRQTLEIGRSGGDLLLYDAMRRVSVKMPRESPTLTVTESTRQIFEQ